MALATKAVIGDELACLRLAIENRTERNFEQVQAELVLPEGVDCYLSASEADDEIDAPQRPEPWGELTIGRLRPPIRTPVVARSAPADEVEHGRQTRVRFAPVHVRPGAVVPLPDIHLMIGAEHAGSQIAVRWRMTSTSTDGWREGDVVCNVDGDVAYFNSGAADTEAA